jgi:hypothetical protein
LKKNTATKWLVFAFDLTDNTPVTGDAANITADVYIDGSVNAVDDTNPTELAHGYYMFDITGAETNGDHIMIDPVSATGDVQVIGVPGSAWTDTLAADIATVDSNLDALIVTVGTPADTDIATDIANLDTVVDGLITTVGTPADTDIATDIANLDTVVDGLITTVGAPADTDIATDIANVQTVVDALTVGAIADAVWDEVLTGATHNVATSAGRRLRSLGGNAVSSAVDDPGAAATTTVFNTDLTEADGYWNEQLIYFTTGSLAGQCKPILEYLNASGQITLSDELTAAPANNDEFDILPAHIHPMTEISDAVWDDLVSSHVGAGSFGEAIDTLASAGAAPTAADIADAVWDEAQADHVSAGSFGDLGIAQDAKLDAIITDTDELQGDLTDGGRLDALIDAILLDTGTTLPDLLAVVDGNVDSILVDTGTTLDAAIADLQSDITDILADTDELQDEWADGGRLDLILDAASAPTAADVADAVWDEAIAGHAAAGSTGEALAGAASAGDPWVTPLPGAYGAGSAGKKLSDAITQITAILVDTGTSIPASLVTIDSNVDAILADTNELQSDDTPAALTALDAKIDVIDGIVDSIVADTNELQTDWEDGGRLDLILDSVAAPASAAAIADAVWDEAIAAHSSAGSTGLTLAQALAGLSSSVAGLGSVSNTITVTVGGVGLEGVDVWVTSDEAGTTVVAGTLQTDTNGEVVFLLDPGTYYVWQQKTGYNFECPDELTVT